MSQFLLQIFSLLTDSPGNLVYHLIVSFSVLGAFIGVFQQYRLNASGILMRAMVGLGLLLFVRVGLFLLSFLTVAGVLNQHVFMPPVDRFTTALSVLVIAWLWYFPSQSKLGDWVASLLGLITFVGLLISFPLWSSASDNYLFNQHILDLVWNVFGIGLATLGAGLLIFTRKGDWQLGFVIQAVFMLGFFTQLILGREIENDFSGAIRFFAIIGYPLLFALPQNYLSLGVGKTQVSDSADQFVPLRTRYNVRPETLDAFFALALESALSEKTKAIVHAVGQAMIADICLLLYCPDENGDVMVTAGYDLMHESEIRGGLLLKHDVPLIGIALQKGRALRLPASSTSLDLDALGKYLQLPEKGNLLLAPVNMQENERVGGIALYSPYSKRNWDAEEQDYLLKIGSVVAQLLSPEPTGGIERRWEENSEESIDQEKIDLQDALRDAKSEMVQLEEDNMSLLEEIIRLRENVKEPADVTPALAPLIAAQERAKEQLAIVELENQQLKDALEQLQQTREESQKIDTLDGVIDVLRDALDSPAFANAEEGVQIGVLKRALMNAGVSGVLSDRDGLVDDDNEIEELRESLLEQPPITTGELLSKSKDLSGEGLQIKPQELKALGDRLADLELENELLRNSVEEVKNQKETIDKFLAALQGTHNEALDTVNRLQAENSQLKTLLEQASSRAIVDSGQGLLQKNGGFHKDLENTEIEGELNSALAEVARLQRVLGEMEVRAFQLERQAQNTALATRRWTTIINLTQELRQPMSSIVGYTDFLLSESVGILGSLQRKFLDRVKTSTERMNTMIEDLLQIAAMESGQLQLQVGLVNLSDVIDNALSQTSVYFREKNIVLRMDLPDDLPLVQGDQDAMHQVIINLLQNAGDVTPINGEIGIVARLENYGSGDDQNFVLVSVKDSGPGIALDDLQSVFEYTPDKGHNHINGVGHSLLGLSISKTLVEAHGGRIWVDTELDHGASFSMLLPIRKTFPKTAEQQAL